MPYGDYNRKREVFPATPFLFLQTRNQYLSWSANANFVWNTEAVNTSDFKYVLGESKIFILTSGYYEIIYEASVFLYSGAMTEVLFAIVKNGVAIEGSSTYATFANAYASSVTGHYYTYLNRGDYVQFRSYVGVGGGTIRTEEDTVRFIIKGMSMEGWNNGRGSVNNGSR